MEYALLISGIQAILAAIGVWQKERDHKKTQETYQEKFSETLNAPDIQIRVAKLQQVLPEKIAITFRKNLDACWESFNGCIEGKSTDEEIVPCEEKNQTCICANLRSIVRNNGSLPPDIYSLWMQFGCGPKPPLSLPVAFTMPITFATNDGEQVAATQYQKLKS